MSLRNKCICVLFNLSLGALCIQSLQLSVKQLEPKIVIQKYFPSEKSLCVVMLESDTEVLLPTFHVSVIILTQDRVFQECGSELTAQEGYLIMTSNRANLEAQIVPLLKCFNQTALKLKTKYILVFDMSDGNKDTYSNFFLNLWKAYGIINIAVVPAKYHMQNFDFPVVFTYNPFFAQHASLRALMNTNLSQDVRAVMTSRFRDMYGYRLKTVFYKIVNIGITVRQFKMKQTLGAEPGLLFKQILELYLNASFDIYEPPENEAFSTLRNGAVQEVANGKAEYCLNIMSVKSSIIWPKTVQLLTLGYGFHMVFVVPMPRQIESWQLFQYIFQWQLSLGLAFVLLLLTACSLLFFKVHSITNISHQSSFGTSEMFSIWKAALSITINRLPTTHSQRLLIAWSLFLGLIFPTLFNVQLFALIKLKPRSPSIKTLHELQDSNLPVYVINNQLVQALNSFQNTSLSKLKDNFKNDRKYENADFFDPKYLNITDRAVVYTKEMISLISSLPQNRKYLQYFDVVKEPIFQDSLVTHLPIGSVYFESFNGFTLRLVSGGIFIKWYEAQKSQIIERYIKVYTMSSYRSSQGNHSADNTSDNKTDDVHGPLTYDDLKMAFYILYIGLTISVVCFLMEISFSFKCRILENIQI